MKTMDELLQTEVPSMKMVADFLKAYSKEKRWGRVEDTQRTIQECYGYVSDQAKKQANGASSVAIEDATVYQWAVDFYNLDKVETKPIPEVKTVKVEKPKPVEKPKVEKKKAPQDEQLSLFD